METIDPQQLQLASQAPQDIAPHDIVLNIQLGDIISINSQSNPIINNQIFLVKYIDKAVVVLIGKTGEISFTIDETTGQLSNTKDIDEITTISRVIEPGYAKQNNLLPNVWIDIYFIGDIPTVMGKITNLVEDMKAFRGNCRFLK
jgi:hypothetical protein